MPEPFTFPSWMTTVPNMKELQATYKGLPGNFDTSGISSAYNTQMGLNTARNAASASASARAAQNRAARMGGSVAASFARGSAMMPSMMANAAMQSDLAGKQLQAKQGLSEMQLAAASNLARFRQQQMGMGAAFYGDEMGRSQQANQFNANLGQRGKEFDAEMALRTRQQNFAEDQYDDQFGLQQAQLAKQYGGGGVMTNFNVDTMGRPMSIADAQRMGYWQANTGGFSGGGGGGGMGMSGLGFGITPGQSKRLSQTAAARNAVNRGVGNAFDTVSKFF